MMKLIVCVVVCLAVCTHQNPATTGDAAVLQLVDQSNFHDGLTNEERSILLKNILETALGQLRKGRTVFGLPVPDPFVLRNNSFAEINENANLNVSFGVLNIHGFKDLQFKRLSTFKENKTLIIEAILPRADADGTYTMDGNLLLLALRGDGEVFASLFDIWAFVKVVIGLDYINGKVTASIDIPDLTFTYKKLEILLTNIDTQGDNTLNEAIHHFLNNNHEFMMQNLRPPIIKRLRGILGQFISAILDSFDPAYLYPEEVKRLRSNL